MARRVATLGELVRETGLEEDEVLIHLWEAGLDRYTSLGNRVQRCDVDRVHKALALPTRKELQDPDYWCRVFAVDETGLRGLLDSMGFRMSPASRTLPRGSISKLRARARAGLARPKLDVPRTEDDPRPEAPHEWRILGHKTDLRLLTQAEVEAIHRELVRDFADHADPIDPPGVRSDHLLGSAVFRQHTSSGGETKYPTVEMAAAAILHALVHDHPFHNGNKRTALVSMLVLLDENGLMLTCDEDELFKFVVRLAQHKIVKPGRDLADREVDSAAEWICSNSRPVEKGDRAVQMRRLRRILADHGCEVTADENRLNVARVIEEKTMLGRSRRTTLRTQIMYVDDGRDVRLTTLKKIRKDLYLDDDHGVDSQSFYLGTDAVASTFIVTYRKTLKRLARL